MRAALHQGRHGTAHLERADDVDGVGGGDVLGRQAVQILHVDDLGGGARVVDQRVDAAEALFHLFGQREALGVVGDVVAYHQSLGAGRKATLGHSVRRAGLA